MASARSSLRSAGVSFSMNDVRGLSVDALNSVPQYLKPVFYANGKEQIKQKLVARPH